MNNYVNQYQEAQINTASKEQILIMLYDGLIMFLNKAKIAMEEKNIQNSHNALMRAQKIILEFMNTLDFEVGGEIAHNLYALYEFLYDQLVKANLKKDISKVEVVLSHIKDLRNTWTEAIKIAAKERIENESEEDFSEEVPRLGVINV